MDKYLRQYAERGTTGIENLPAGEPWQQVVVIPVCNESTGILRPLPPAPGRSLMILVVNETELAGKRVSAANRAFVAGVRSRFELQWQSDDDAGLAFFKDLASPRDILLVDRFSDGLSFPPKGGVGHARKLGADLAARLIHERRVQSPWIHCSDADVHLPDRYFICSGAIERGDEQNISTLIYPFEHVIASDSPDAQKVMEVTRLYEYSLQYYVDGLHYAGSPYAFHTVGSTMAVNALHYARVRGFPRRQAGEDFYLLNKLAKVGSIRQLRATEDCQPITITARRSDRVPFGTGAATVKLLELEDPENEFLLYHPGVFELLRSWLDSLPDFWALKSSDIGAVLSAPEWRTLVEGLDASGVVKALEHALRQSSDEKQFKRQMHTWFDAFRTLKLIHYLRDHHLPSVSYRSLVKNPAVFQP